MTCSSAGSEGSGHGREEWSWSTVLGAVQRCLREESAWSTATHCWQHSECLMSSVVSSTGGGVGDWLVLLLSLHQVSLTLINDPTPYLDDPTPYLDDPTPYLDDPPPTLMTPFNILR